MSESLYASSSNVIFFFPFFCLWLVTVAASCLQRERKEEIGSNLKCAIFQCAHPFIICLRCSDKLITLILQCRELAVDRGAAGLSVAGMKEINVE